MNEALESGDLQDFVIAFPAAIKANWEFKGFVNAFSTSAETSDAVKFSATIRVSGQPKLKKTA